MTGEHDARTPLLIVILGPTASGKSTLAVTLADYFDGEIISCDSVAVYRHFEIGTAKPSHAERALVPHHLIDVADPGDVFTAGEYARQARTALAGISSRGKLPIVVGGTGLYLRALLEGLFPGPQRSEDLRQRLRNGTAQHGSTYLHRVLSRLDPFSAAQIHANDVPKLIRAIEVCLANRRPITKLWQERGRDRLTGYRILRVGLSPDREQLYDHINARAAAMFERGLVAETKLLLKQYPHLAASTPFRSLGYKQAMAYLGGELALAQAVALTQQGHRNYAKRQMTWFRREPDVSWLSGFGDDPAIAASAIDLVRSSVAVEDPSG